MEFYFSTLDNPISNERRKMSKGLNSEFCYSYYTVLTIAFLTENMINPVQNIGKRRQMRPWSGR